MWCGGVIGGWLVVLEQELHCSDVVASAGLVESGSAFLVTVVDVASERQQQLQDALGKTCVALRLARHVVLAHLAGVDHSVLIQAVGYLRVWRKASFK